LFAGYLAPRAAAFEHRVAGLVVDPAQPNMGARVPQGVAGRIAPTSSPCRCAAVPTAGSSSVPDGRSRHYERVGLLRFTEAQGASGHCGGLGQRVLEGVIFDWAAGVLDGRSPT
jgi:hypothetical protein